MAKISDDVFKCGADLSLWFKVRSGEPLNLADVPEMIPLRWLYFRDSWSLLKSRLGSSASSYRDPDYFRDVLDDLDSFISQQRSKGTDDNPFSDSGIYYRFYPVFDTMSIEQIGVTNEEKSLLDKRRAAVRAFSRADFLRIKQVLTEYRDSLADRVGLGDPDYDRIHDRGSVSAQLTPRLADLNLMRTVHNQIASADFVLANLFAVEAVVDPFALARQNANNPDVSIGQYSSGYLVKLDYGEDLQSLADRCLGDRNKWIDIAIANGLREPYIDEVGIDIPFLSNARGSQVNIASSETAKKLYVGQPVFVHSSTMPFPDQRTVTSIREVPVSGETVLSLSGEALDAYTLEDTAGMRVYEPNTVNSSQYILIPSTVPLDNTRQDDVPWFMSGCLADEKKTKIDLAIDERGALMFTSDGDIALSYGLANAVQAVKLKLSAEIGSNRYHPKYGLVNIVGTKNISDEEVKNTLVTSITSQIRADPRFDRIESISVTRVNLEACAYNIDLVVKLAGADTKLPISFSIAV